MISNTDFCTGLVVGIAVAGILGFGLQQILYLVARVRESGQPQKVVHLTAKTPNQVVLSSLRAGCMLFILTIAVIGICYFALVVVE